MKKVLALDLEGTLISNAVSQIPRPGLYDFLDQAKKLFPRIVIFTTVPDELFRCVARGLVNSGDVPAWFAELQHVKWEGQVKDLRFVNDSSVEDILLVDDYEGYVSEDQKKQWIAIKSFESPYQADDRELIRILDELSALCRR
ncbi:MAG: hypothetical protein E4G91_06135 [Candidatus Zixiibacteriota bacterium]|nr:MAG: hypothetical protein E4G91_06135 [candidate division Zixibacteria bacterium]